MFGFINRLLGIDGSHKLKESIEELRNREAYKKSVTDFIIDMEQGDFDNNSKCWIEFQKKPYSKNIDSRAALEIIQARYNKIDTKMIRLKRRKPKWLFQSPN